MLMLNLALAALRQLTIVFFTADEGKGSNLLLGNSNLRFPLIECCPDPRNNQVYSQIPKFGMKIQSVDKMSRNLVNTFFENYPFKCLFVAKNPTGM